MARQVTDFNALIFDWDGTLMDSVGNIVRAVQYAAQLVGLPVPDPGTIRSGIGRSFDSQYTTLFLDQQSAASCDLAMHKRDDFRCAFYAHYHRLPACTFDTVESVLSSLQQADVSLAIATSGTRAMLDTMLHRFNLAHFFQVTCCGDEFPAKPEPDMLQYIAQFLDLSAPQLLMVGDSVNDIYAAQYAGMAAIGVVSGVDSGAALRAAGAAEVVDNLTALLNCQLD